MSASEPTLSLLVVDRDPDTWTLLEHEVPPAGFRLQRETSVDAAIAAVERVRPDAALLDLGLLSGNAPEVFDAIKKINGEAHVIFMSASEIPGDAIAAVKSGVLDYLSKPLDPTRLTQALMTVSKGIERRERLLGSDADLARQFEFHGLIGRNPAMQELFDAVRRYAPYARAVLVTGETGTGKELVARALHRLGPRKSRRLVTINCSAVVETLFESELFGHMRGAFTGATDNKVGLFEHADHGTIFLDELGELPLSMQAKLLRTLETGEVQRVGAVEARRVDVFTIAATNRNLHVESNEGRFRSDLYYRLNLVELRIPPLRQRPEDIPFIAAAFIRQCTSQLGRGPKGISAGAERRLQSAAWPGNVRELRNVIERVCMLSDSRIVSEAEIARAMGADTPEPPRTAVAHASDHAPHATNSLAEVQAEQIRRVLQNVGGNKTAAAKQLGVSRRALYRWLERLETTH